VGDVGEKCGQARGVAEEVLAEVIIWSARGAAARVRTGGTASGTGVAERACWAQTVAVQTGKAVSGAAVGATNRAWRADSSSEILSVGTESKA
jgi:hypothetical protein